MFEEAVAAEESGYGQVETEAYLCLYRCARNQQQHFVKVDEGIVGFGKSLWMPRRSPTDASKMVVTEPESTNARMRFDSNPLYAIDTSRRGSYVTPLLAPRQEQLSGKTPGMYGWNNCRSEEEYLNAVRGGRHQ